MMDVQWVACLSTAAAIVSAAAVIVNLAMIFLVIYAYENEDGEH